MKRHPERDTCRARRPEPLPGTLAIATHLAHQQSRGPEVVGCAARPHRRRARDLESAGLEGDAELLSGNHREAALGERLGDVTLDQANPLGLRRWERSSANERQECHQGQ